MCGEFGEVTVIIGLVINFLAFVSPLLSFHDTMTYITANFLDFPPNFRLRTRHQYCTTPMSRHLLAHSASRLCCHHCHCIPKYIQSLSLMNINNSCVNWLYFNNLLIIPVDFTIYALLSRFLFCRDLRTFSANFCWPK